MKKFIAPQWHKIFTRQGLDFDALWRMDLKPLDEPNVGRGRGGWSSVSRLSLQLSDGNEKRLILKRQKNHFSHTLCHPFRGIPTFEKEISSILRYKRLGIPALEPVFYERRSNSQGIQAILITEYLEGYMPLDELVSSYQEQGWPERAWRNRLIKALASPVRKLHEKGFQHNCLYPRHLFIRQKGQEIRVRVIDLEKNKWRPLSNKRRIRDLESLHRRTGGFSRSDRLRFLNAYCGVKRLDKNARRLCRQIIRQNRKKMEYDSNC
ncbi:MAG: lipopolysaccharide kinase [Deltaproteobacteria bacterium]|nr:lipopolysaccharide kinase [Deltaproteobacteria bacterium]MBW2119137.1 lipopolysaccharide kinase [Deltaproteobacteria bacterium]MBW2344632.1 lipopolysaccharide kinase [Deltaproteobacteria bacterium]